MKCSNKNALLPSPHTPSFATFAEQMAMETQNSPEAVKQQEIHFLGKYLFPPCQCMGPSPLPRKFSSHFLLCGIILWDPYGLWILAWSLTTAWLELSLIFCFYFICEMKKIIASILKSWKNDWVIVQQVFKIVPAHSKLNKSYHSLHHFPPECPTLEQLTLILFSKLLVLPKMSGVLSIHLCIWNPVARSKLEGWENGLQDLRSENHICILTPVGEAFAESGGGFRQKWGSGRQEAKQELQRLYQEVGTLEAAG